MKSVNRHNRTIVIVIGASDEIRIDAVGFQGPDCEQVTRYQEAALGVVKQKTKKPEFHQKTVTRNQQRLGG